VFSEQALAVWRELSDREGMIRSLNELGNVAVLDRLFEEAEIYFDQALSLATGHEDPLWLPVVQANRAGVMLSRGRFAEARPLYETVLEVARRYDYEIGVVNALLGLALVELGEGRPTAAARPLEEAFGIAEALRFMESVGDCLNLAAALAAAKDDGEDAAWFLGAADAVDESTGSSRALPAFVSQLIEHSRVPLGDGPFEAARQKGKSTSVEAAIAAARTYLFS
jgi:tetratricopeptide (TPR) repeat protein